MTFVCTVDLNNAHSDTFQRGSDVLISTPIGYDDTSPLNYFLWAGFSPTPTSAEFFFSVIKVDGADNREEQIRDSRLIGSFISHKDRNLIKNCLLVLAHYLVKTNGPDVFFMTTYLANLPNRALEKYNDLCHVFSGAGYRVAKSDPFKGHSMWWVERNT